MHPSVSQDWYLTVTWCKGGGGGGGTQGQKKLSGFFFFFFFFLVGGCVTVSTFQLRLVEAKVIF